MMISIKPMQVVNKIAVSIIFQPATVDYGSGCSTVYSLLDENGKEIYKDSVQVTPEQYAEWGTEDDYIVNCFLENIGVVRA